MKIQTERAAMEPAAPKTDLPPTKRLLTLFAVLSLVAWATGVANANLLINPDLNLASISSQVLPTPSSWIVDASRSSTGVFNDGASSENFANANIPDPGGAFGLFMKPFQGSNPTNFINVNFYQDHSAAPGVGYSLTGWFGAGAGYSGLIPLSPTKSQFALDFLNASSTVISSAVLDLGAAGLGAVNGQPFGYRQFVVQAFAPVGTAFVRSRASMVNGFANPAGGDQAFVADYFNLVVAVPEPSTFALLGLGIVGLVAIRRRS